MYGCFFAKALIIAPFLAESLIASFINPVHLLRRPIQHIMALGNCHKGTQKGIGGRIIT